MSPVVEDVRVARDHLRAAFDALKQGVRKTQDVEAIRAMCRAIEGANEAWAALGTAHAYLALPKLEAEVPE